MSTLTQTRRNQTQFATCKCVQKCGFRVQSWEKWRKMRLPKSREWNQSQSLEGGTWVAVQNQCENSWDQEDYWYMGQYLTPFKGKSWAKTRASCIVIVIAELNQPRVVQHFKTGQFPRTDSELRFCSFDCTHAQGRGILHLKYAMRFSPHLSEFRKVCVLQRDTKLTRINTDFIPMLAP
jgi:hypothetical protein